MSEKIVNIHSVIDVITNSSTEIFMSTTPSAVEHMRDIIDAVLKTAGSDKTCDDLFVIEKVLTEGTYEQCADMFADEIEGYEDIAKLLTPEAIKEVGNWDNRNRTDKLVGELKQLTKDGKIDWDEIANENEYAKVEYTIRITAKDGTDLGLAEKIYDLFDASEWYRS